MTPHPFEAAFHRVQRVKKHLTDLGEMLTFMEREKKNSVVSYIQNKGLPSLVAGDKIIINFPMVTAITIGEFLYNIRTALDYMIFKLIKNHTIETKNFTNFPIVDTPDKFKTWRKSARLKGIDEVHIAALKRLQPYDGCDWTRALGKLSNIDKHREFTPLGGPTGITFYTVAEDANFSAIISPIISAKHPRTGVEMDMKFDIAPAISFYEGAPVMETLQKICLGVIETLKAFDPKL